MLLLALMKKGKRDFFYTDMRWIGPCSKQHHESCTEVPQLLAMATTN